MVKKLKAISFRWIITFFSITTIFLVIGVLAIVFLSLNLNSMDSNPAEIMNYARTHEVENQPINGFPYSFYKQNITGKNIKVAVLDTGIDRKSSEFNIKAGHNFVSNNNDFQDDNGHGTAMAGIIAAKKNGYLLQGIAYDAELYIGKVANAEGQSRIQWLINGIKWAIQEKVNVINISIEYSKGNSDLQQVIEEAVKQHIVVVASSGDVMPPDMTTTTINTAYPAKYSVVLSVGMLNTEGLIYSTDFQKRKVDIFAPGENVSALYLGNKLTFETNTSAATAYASGLIALQLEKDKGQDSPQQIKERLNAVIQPQYPSTFNSIIGMWPILVSLLAVGFFWLLFLYLLISRIHVRRKAS
jgi:subtilisin family serine protease